MAPDIGLLVRNMANSDQYRRELDIVFQEIEEKEKLQRRARTDERLKFLAAIADDRDMAAMFLKGLKDLPEEECKRRLKRLIDCAFPEDEGK